MQKKFNIAIVGASGAVGEEMLQCLNQGFMHDKIARLKLLGSNRSAGKEIKFQNQTYQIETCNDKSFADCDFALFSAGASTAKQFAPKAVSAGAVVIDNSSAFRNDSEVPLIVPEINPEDTNQHQGIIANPNCTTIIMLMGLAPLHQKWQVKKIIASSYQSVSGSGAQGILEFKKQQAKVTRGEEIDPPVYYPRQIIDNVIPLIGNITDNGYTNEEMKLQNETRKILHAKDILASSTCVRVPVLRSHSVAVCAQFSQTPDAKIARKILKNSTGIKLADEPENGIFPTPLDSTQKHECIVGRIRKDIALENALSFWVVGDQLLKGAALNATQILELLVKNRNVN